MDGQPLPLPVSEILAYCEMYGIQNLDARQRISMMVRAQDAAFRKVVRERAERDAKNR